MYNKQLNKYLYHFIEIWSVLFQNNLIPKTFPLQVFLGLIQMF